MQLKGRILAAALIILLIAATASIHVYAKRAGYLDLKLQPFQYSSGNTNYTYIINVTGELNNSANAGFNFTANDFKTSSQSQCQLVLINQCDNNDPYQFACINQKYNLTYDQQYAAIVNHSTACPDYFLAGQISCLIYNGYCSVAQNSNATYHNSSYNTTTSYSTTIYTNGTQPENGSSNSTTVGQGGSTRTTTIYNTTTSYPTTTVSSNASNTKTPPPTKGSSWLSNIINEIIQFFQSLFKK